MTENTVFFLDCETKDRDNAMTTFSARLDDLISDYAGWLQQYELTAADVLCPMIFRCSDLACVATLGLEDGRVILQPRRVYGGPFAKLVNNILFELRFMPRRLRYRSAQETFERVHDGDRKE